MKSEKSPKQSTSLLVTFATVSESDTWDIESMFTSGRRRRKFSSRFSPHALSTLGLAWVLTWVTLLGVAFGVGRPVLSLVLSATWGIKCNKLMLHVVRPTWCQSPHLLHRLVGKHLQAACNLLASLSNLSCSWHCSAVPFYLRFFSLNSLSALFSLGKSVFYHNDEKL